MPLQAYCIIFLTNLAVVSTISLDKKEAIINQLSPLIVEAETIDFESHIDDSNLDTLKDLSIYSKFYISTQSEKNNNSSCIGLGADLSKGRILRILHITEILQKEITKTTTVYPYVKDYCLTYLITYENNEDIKWFIDSENRIFHKNLRGFDPP